MQGITPQFDLVRSLAMTPNVEGLSASFKGDNPSATREGEDKALRAAAQQFESLFMNMMMKSMRSASRVFSEGNYLNSFETGMYEDMLDEKLSETMASSHGLGIADLMMQQLGAQSRPASYSLQMAAAAMTSTDNAATGKRQAAFADPAAFVDQLLPVAAAVADQIGVSSRGLLSQAALETAWGQHVVHTEHGANSHNLFGIKAGSDWQGETVRMAVVEVRDGVVGQEVGHLKRYGSYAEAFDDYARLLGGGGYEQVLAAGTDETGFARAMNQSGYATDPDYGNRLLDVLGHDALQVARPVVRG